MTVIIFLIILSILVIVHELGHFLTAKATHIRVDEFGLGYPPRAKHLFNWQGTEFTLNWLPFGGFVRIFGENPSEESEGIPGSFTSTPRYIQAMVLIAGVSANILLAWALFSLSFMIGIPASEDSDLPISNPVTTITQVVEGSPAAKAGIQSGDQVVSVGRRNMFSNTDPDQISNFISASEEPVTFTLKRGEETVTVEATPVGGLVEGHPAVGVGLDSVGIAKLPFFRALIEGARNTWRLAGETVKGIYGLFVGHNFSQVTGPVGLVTIVGQASKLGFTYLLSLTALISINLAVLNLLPIPALDGGRLLFVIIEAIRRKKISPKLFNTVNGISFSILILLMILVTVRDVVNLF